MSSDDTLMTECITADVGQPCLVKLDIDNVPVAKDLKELVTILNQIFAGDSVNVEYVIRLLENYKSNAKDWRQYAKYDPHK